jgi:hypothetical protein
MFLFRLFSDGTGLVKYTHLCNLIPALPHSNHTIFKVIFCVGDQEGVFSGAERLLIS